MSDTVGYAIFLFPVGCLLGWALWRMLRDSRDAQLRARSMGWPQAQGKVNSNVQVWSHAEVQYEYSVSSRSYTGIYTIPLYKQSRFNSPEQSAKEFAECLASFAPGSNILVRYNPKRPEESILDHRIGPAKAIPSLR